MILRHRLRNSFNSRPGLPGRESERMTRSSSLLVILAAVRILHG
jgi:hypothetical protein